MGGRVAQWLAIDHSQGVRTLILAATSGGKLAGAEPTKYAMEALVSGDMAPLEPLFFAPEWAADHSDAIHTFFNSRATAWAKARHFRASRDHDAWSRLGSIESPTLILNCRPAICPDVAAARTQAERFVAVSDIVKASDEDLAWLYPHRTPEESLAAWLELGPALVVLTRGASGPVILARQGRAEMAADPSLWQTPWAPATPSWPRSSPVWTSSQRSGPARGTGSRAYPAMNCTGSPPTLTAPRRSPAPGRGQTRPTRLNSVRCLFRCGPS
ncbi:hypothetical protein ACVWY0_001811 [Arthrobacter sp. UYNi723]